MTVLRQVSRRPPSVPAVAGFLIGRGAVIEPLPETTGAWPGAPRRAYVPDVSTRGFELSVEGGRFTISVPTLACPEDRDLAYALAAAVIDGTDDAIELDGARVSASHLAPLPGASAVVFAKDCAEVERRARKAVISLPGPRRDFHVGPRLVEELGSDPARWAAAMRRVQFGPAADAPRERRAAGARSVSVAALAPGTPALLAPCDLVRLGDDEDAPMVPFARFVEVARAEPVDERSVVLGALTTAEWDALVARARPFAVDDVEEESPPAPAVAAPLAIEIASPEPASDGPAGPPIVRGKSLSRRVTLATSRSPEWALPVFGGLLFVLALALSVGLVAVFAVWFGA